MPPNLDGEDTLMPPEEPVLSLPGPDGGTAEDWSSSVGDNGGVLEGPDLNISRSPFDKKEYRQLLLPNGLRVVLVSDVAAMTQAYNSGGLYGGDGDDVSDDDEGDDDEGDDHGGGEPKRKEESPRHGDDDEEEDGSDDGGGGGGGLRNAAAAMIVGVGSMYDPPECQGMAHFLEHLLFMGSEKYPEENAYDAFMSKHGGDDNAYTEMEHTVYHFEIPQEHLGNALDIFSQFFVAPLMLESSVDRELSAVESEFQLVKNEDNTRVQQLMCHTAGRTPAEHPAVQVRTTGGGGGGSFANCLFALFLWAVFPFFFLPNFSHSLLLCCRLPLQFGWGNLKSLKEIPERMNINPLLMLREFFDKVREIR